MGSLSSVPKIQNEDMQDKDIVLPKDMTHEELMCHCSQQLLDSPFLLKRTVKVLNQSAENDTDRSFRVMQWNILSQALGVNNDKFVQCPDEALNWSRRRYQILQELITYTPDIICLQEVDHYDFFQKTLSTRGYSGLFCPKPDSPCIYIKDNNGPDGCAIFYNNRFTLIATYTRVLEVWKIESNQVVIVAILRDNVTNNDLCVATTHLKARKGALLASLRNEQGKDLLEFVKTHSNGRPMLICGDFNAEPTEPVYRTMVNNEMLKLSSAYFCDNKEPPYTTWKIREEGEICHTIDYIFYSKESLSKTALLKFPEENDIGEGRIPSLMYPSDHFSLACDFTFLN